MAELEPATGLSPLMRAHTQGVRAFTRDYGELNLLIRGEETSDRMIAWSTLDFLSDFNGTTTPQTSFSLEALYMRGLQSFCVKGTVVTMLQSLQCLYTRNSLPFSDGGISISMNDKAAMVGQQLNFLSSMHEQNKRGLKIAFNIEQLLSPDSTGLFSDYAMLASSYGAF